MAAARRARRRCRSPAPTALPDSCLVFATTALNAWRETPFFTDRERAALEWTEQGSRVADTHVPDEVYQRATAQFDEAELVALTFAVIVINS
jgi:alkylhydroperoxidase family enzyme